jgi:hypothetical protein
LFGRQVYRLQDFVRRAIDEKAEAKNDNDIRKNGNDCADQRLSARDSVCSWPKQLRRMQGFEFATHDYEDIL